MRQPVTPSPAPEHPASGAVRSSLAMITIGTMLATLIQGLDMTISNVALPYMAGTFASSYDEATWVLTYYIIAAAIMTPPTGWLSARFGRRRVFVVSIVGFVVASVLCGMCQTLTQAIVARALQGMAGAALTPLSQATLLDTYPRERHPQAMAIWGMGIMLGPILGPTLGGWLTFNLDWRWVYYINVPIGGIAAAVVFFYVPETRRQQPPRFDMLGFCFLSAAVAGLQIVLDRGEIDDWFSSPTIVTAAVVAGTGFFLFLVQILLGRDPFIRPDLFADRNFVLGLVLNVVVSILLMGTMSLFPPLLQDVLNFPVVTVGLLLAPRGFGTMAAMVVVGRLSRYIPPRFMILSGFLITAVAMHGMAGFSLQIGPREVLGYGLIQGFGLGMIFPVLVSSSFGSLSQTRRVEAAGVYNLVRNVGSSAGISIMTALVDHNTQVNHAIIAQAVTPFSRNLFENPVFRFYDVLTARGTSFLNSEVTQQATMIAYIDDFKLMMILAVMASMAALLMPGAGGAPRR